ncbi:hypothetical protein [Nonomuraea sp. NPDC049028]|uniref:hypothetical protein n=1 Tax=Nonomuraea sp. NPDC049028 TaxID=3364348 RepID=UPI003724677D
MEADDRSAVARIMALLGLVGEVEWARIAVGPTLDGKPRPPLLVWRFKQGDKPLEEQLALAVNAFRGRVGWLLERTDRNWFLIPKQVSEAVGRGGRRTDSEAILYFAESRPDYSRDSMEDLEDIILCIEHALE